MLDSKDSEQEQEKAAGKVEDCVLYFLNERKERGFTSEEMMGGLSIDVDFSTQETSKMSTFMVADFTALLFDLVRKEKIEMKYIDGRMHFQATEHKFKCPKCDKKFGVPKKKWEMMGRPDSKGMRTRLVIGIFNCPTHGTFRAVMDKQKIPSR